MGRLISTCLPKYSKKTINDFKELDPKGYESGEYQVFLENDWAEKTPFWQSLEKTLPSLKRLQLAGGEPFINKALQSFLKRAVELGVSQNIDLSFSTNLTFFPKEVYELFKDYKSVSLFISLDGTEKVNSYIRYPSKWSKIVENIRFVDENYHSLNLDLVNIHTVVQIYNIFNLVELSEWASENLRNISSEIDFFPLEEPAKKEMEEIAGLKAIMNFMTNRAADAERQEEFRKKTEVYNRLRKTSIYDLQPNLVDL